MRLDLTCAAFGIFTSAFAVFFKDSIDRNLLTMSLQIMSDVIFFFSISIRMLAEIQNMMTSPQRIYQYTQLESEDALEKPCDEDLKGVDWPFEGKVKFDKLSMRYRDFMDPSIRDLDCEI